LDDGISPDWVVKRSNKDIRARRPSSPDCRIHVRDQIACPFRAERIWDWRLETEN
jgi:hypothetical protein